MYARVAHLDGVTGDERRTIAGAPSGPSEGVPATGRAVLDVDAGRVLAITAFENEEDLRRGDDTFERADREADRGRGSEGRRGGMT